MNSLGPSAVFDRTRVLAVADVVAILLAVSLPWSTSATGILAAIYVIVALPLLRRDDLATLRSMQSAWLPLALVGLCAVGMLWADVTWHEKLAGFTPFAKLSAVPLFLLHFQRSDRAQLLIATYIVACTALLIASLLPLAVPSLRPLLWSRSIGVPVKDYISQSGQFLICVFALLYLAVGYAKVRRVAAALGAVVLALIFIADIVYLTSSRTAFVIFPVLLVLLGMRLFGPKGIAAALVAALVVAAVAWVSSPYVRLRTGSVVTEISQYDANNAQTSSGERLEFWKKSLRFIAAAPVIGHGTGSMPSLYRGAVVGETGASSEATTNPHNQTFAVGIQLGGIGIVLLWAMWIAHLLLFRPPGFVAWFGLAVVASNIVGSLFNSHLSDFTQGWVYVVLVGVAGGVMLRERANGAGSP